MNKTKAVLHSIQAVSPLSKTGKDGVSEDDDRCRDFRSSGSTLFSSNNSITFPFNSRIFNRRSSDIIEIFGDSDIMLGQVLYAGST